eukprot:8282031-Ditylum_brightwellii.AAC.1
MSFWCVVRSVPPSEDGRYILQDLPCKCGLFVQVVSAETYGDHPTWSQYLEEANDVETSGNSSMSNTEHTPKAWHCRAVLSWNIF